MSIATFSQAPAGWYPVPHREDTVRYWDGVRWTGSVVALPRAGKTRGTTILVVAGYLGALLIPIVGFVIGLVLLTAARRSGHGVAVLVVSGVAFLLYFAFSLLAYLQV